MKILMLTPYLPYPPSSGGQVRSYNLIKNLCKDHEITLFSLIKEDGESLYVKELEKYCRKVRIFKRSLKPWTLANIFKTGFSFYPFVVVRNFSKEEEQALVEELNLGKYDLIHAETFYVMPHLPQTKIPVVLVDQTIEFMVYQHYVKTVKNIFLKLLFYIDVFKIKFWELKFWQKASRVVAVSEADKEKMQSLVKRLKVNVVPNGAGEDLMNLWGIKKQEGRPIVFFQANFNWLQNIEAAENLAKKVFPLIRQRIPGVVCQIVGQEAKEKIGSLKASDIEIIDLSTSDINGVIKAYQGATVFVAPLEGPGGTRLKILAAMAAGVPVVTSTVGIEGIDAEDGKEVLIADKPQQMADMVEKLIKSKIMRQKLAQAARKLVEEKYSYQNIAKKLDGIYREVAGGKN